MGLRHRTSQATGHGIERGTTRGCAGVGRARFHLAADFLAHSAPQDDIHYFTVGLSVHGEPIAF